MEIHWKEIRYKKSLNIFFAYNLPFILWSGFVVILTFLKRINFCLVCPVRFIFGWCPGCGLTTSYVELIRGNGINNIWFAIIFGVFILNLFYSIFKITKLKVNCK